MWSPLVDILNPVEATLKMIEKERAAMVISGGVRTGRGLRFLRQHDSGVLTSMLKRSQELGQANAGKKMVLGELTQRTTSRGSNVYRQEFWFE